MLSRRWRINHLQAIALRQKRCLHLHEYQSQELLKQFNVPVPRGKVAHTPAEVAEIVKIFSENHRRFLEATTLTPSDQQCVVKSQILNGGRKKGSFENGLKGGIQIVDSPEVAEQLASQMLGHRLQTKKTSEHGVIVDKLYVAESIHFHDEWHVSITIDRENYTPVVMISKNGRIGLENTIKNDPEHLHSFGFNLDAGITQELVTRISNTLQASPQEAENLKNILTSLHKLFIAKDATSLEISQLARRADGSFICLDAKFTFDDASEKRQPELFALRDPKSEIEAEIEAQRHGLVYIKMDGNIGNVVNGAGLAMATNDTIAHYGGTSANFLDAGGQATKKTMQKAFDIILKDEQVKVILVNIYGGIIKCDMIAESIIGAAQELGPLRVPLVVRLQGTNSAEGLKILEEANLGFHVESGFGEAAEKAVELSRVA